MRTVGLFTQFLTQTAARASGAGVGWGMHCLSYTRDGIDDAGGEDQKGQNRLKHDFSGLKYRHNLWIFKPVR